MVAEGLCGYECGGAQIWYLLGCVFFWHVWKERGRRIFQREILTPNAVASLIQSDMALLELARSRARG